jgi:hypothetical protein
MKIENREWYKRVRAKADDGDQRAQDCLLDIARCGPPGSVYPTPQYVRPTEREVVEHRTSLERERADLRARISQLLQ